MKRNVKDAIEHRRSYYALKRESPISDQEIKDMVNHAVLHVPSPFNSQSARLVLLLGEQHTKFWDITKETLKQILNEEAYSKTEAKINHSFASGYGTILFYEDEMVVRGLQDAMPTYAEKFGQWAEHTSAMHQFALWVMLEDAGFGASLQHYNLLIDEKVAETWNIPSYWRLIAEMPFGIPAEEPGEKVFQPLQERVLIYE
ncbi:MAG: nitroreductase family protein [Tannerellaceae bacterium]|nr:nitroreductase family protein [Tannerellaceae bacterium]